MKKITLLYVFLILIVSCQKDESFPNLDENPQTEAYRKNRVASYVIAPKSASLESSKDSVLINEHGLPTTHFRFYTLNNQTKTTTTTISYDSINRVKEYIIDGDSHFKMEMKYRKDDNKKIITANLGRGIMHFKFDDDFKKIKRVYVIDSTSLDTVSDFHYRYKEKKLSSILEKSDNKLVEQSAFVYVGDKLKLIRTKDNTTYFSQKTGLADSTSNNKIYKYYFR